VVLAERTFGGGRQSTPRQQTHARDEANGSGSRSRSGHDHSPVGGLDVIRGYGDAPTCALSG